MKKILVLLIAVVLFLPACSYKVDVDLTPEEKTEIHQEINELKEKITSYEGDGFLNLDTIKLARAYKNLGELSKAIDVYKDSIADGFKTRAIINNLGKLYESVGEYDLAIEMYQLMIDEYFETKYLYDITWAYINDGNRKEAERYFNAWQLEFRKTDLQIQEAIKKLRADEKE